MRRHALRPRALPILALSLAGLALSIVSTMHTRGLIRSFWEPFPRVSPGGWMLPSVAAPSPEIELVGFASITLVAALGGTPRLGRMIALDVATGFTAVSALLDWSRQYASTGATSTIHSLSTAVAVATLFVASVHADAMTTRTLRRMSRATTSRKLAGGGAMVLGVWLLLLPVSSVCPKSALHAHVIGPSVVAIGAHTAARVAVAGRWANAAIGAWILLAPLLYDYGLPGAIHAIVIGILLVAVSLVPDEPTHECTRAHGPTSGNAQRSASSRGTWRITWR